MTATLAARLLEHARDRGDEVAIREKHRGVWREWTWARYAKRVADVAEGLRSLGVGPGSRVAIHSENRPEWVIADLAVQGLGACSVGVYPTSPAAEVESDPWVATATSFTVPSSALSSTSGRTAASAIEWKTVSPNK